MTLLELQSCLDRLGVNLSARGDRLVIDAPAGMMTPEIMDRLKAYKPRLIAFLNVCADYDRNERDAIQEYDGTPGTDQEAAERLAEDSVVPTILTHQGAAVRSGRACCANGEGARVVYVRSKVAKGKTYYQIVEGVRVGNRVRQRVVLALGRTPDPRVALGQWKRRLASLRRNRALFGPTSGLSKTLDRRAKSMDAWIAELEAKVEMLAEIIKAGKVGTTAGKGAR